MFSFSLKNGFPYFPATFLCHFSSCVWKKTHPSLQTAPRPPCRSASPVPATRRLPLPPSPPNIRPPFTSPPAPLRRLRTCRTGGRRPRRPSGLQEVQLREVEGKMQQQEEEEVRTCQRPGGARLTSTSQVPSCTWLEARSRRPASPRTSPTRSLLRSCSRGSSSCRSLCLTLIIPETELVYFHLF